MYEILVPVDNDVDRSLRQAEIIEDLPGDAEEIHAIVMHSFEDNPAGASITQVQSARRVHDYLEDAGFEVSFDERSGEPASTILKAARDHDVDMICISGRKRTPTGKVLFGSVTQSVLLDSDRSVLVARRGEND